MCPLSTDNSAIGPVDGIILAGGLSRRFGAKNKAFKTLGGIPLLHHVIDRARPQVARLAISANDDLEGYRDTGLPVIADDLQGHCGPLAGLLAALDWSAHERGPSGWVASFPVDGPFVPRNLVTRLADAARGATVPALARCQARTHPVFALWPTAIRGSLREFLSQPNRRRLMSFAWSVGAREVVFDARHADCFRNINTAADLAEAENIWRGRRERAG